MQRVRMKAHAWVVLAFLTALLFCPMTSAAEEPNIETEQEESQQPQRFEERKENEETRENKKGEEEEATEGIRILSGLPVDKIILRGFIDLDYDYYEVSDVSDKDSTGRTDLGLGSADLELRVFFNEWLKAKFTVVADDIGKQESDNKIKVDDAFFTLNFPWVPLYFKGGYTTLPFGVFEDRLITGTILEDLYEIEQVGATLGFSPDFYGLDISFTVYAGQDIIKNLRNFDIDEYSTAREKDDDVSSFIANLTLEPVEDMLSLIVFYDSEPGDGRRNQTIGSALTLDVWKFSLDGEYITALQREKGDNGKENKESAWVAGLAFRPSESVPVEFVVRYEDFDDDIKGNQDEILDDRYVAGLSYQFLEWATFFFEYDYLNYEKEKDSDAVDHTYELHFRIGLAF
jgi:opacity protein-like surface antigen